MKITINGQTVTLTKLNTHEEWVLTGNSLLEAAASQGGNIGGDVTVLTGNCNVSVGAVNSHGTINSNTTITANVVGI